MPPFSSRPVLLPSTITDWPTMPDACSAEAELKRAIMLSAEVLSLSIPSTVENCASWATKAWLSVGSSGFWLFICATISSRKASRPSSLLFGSSLLLGLRYWSSTAALLLTSLIMLRCSLLAQCQGALQHLFCCVEHFDVHLITAGGGHHVGHCLNDIHVRVVDIAIFVGHRVVGLEAQLQRRVFFHNAHHLYAGT